MNLKERILALKITLGRARAYRNVFGEPGNRTKSQELVIADLARFCRAVESSVIATSSGIDTNATILNEGRREVFNRVNKYAQESHSDLLIQIQKLQEELKLNGN